MVENLAIVSADEAMDAYGVQRVVVTLARRENSWKAHEAACAETCPSVRSSWRAPSSFSEARRGPYWPS
jgi:hypothetical protein